MIKGLQQCRPFFYGSRKLADYDARGKPIRESLHQTA